MAEIDANAAFDAIEAIARSSKNLADMESMKVRARMTIDQFRAAVATKPWTMAKREENLLRQYLDGACATRRVGIHHGRMAFDLPRAEVSRERILRLYLSEAA